MEKQFWKSKKFWTGLVVLVSGIGALFTGEKTFEQVLPEIVVTVFGIIQTFLAFKEGDPVAFGNKVFGRRD